ncbi:spore coat protein, CotS family [Caloramator fervidus]|uniref:Spore coat protein, CotS family n=1 Tax=Caloramator fervidus TaxID=29344 RepID=A0A1H5RJW7_9CLOT|nr:CotS family spore coat protein [Caloramator fervidus]SEF38655.1 spore coat protein, CotS family [Caloramator fervidus]
MRELISLIENKYNIKVLNIEKHKNVYKIYSDKNYCLKVSRYQREEFEFILACINHLLKKGFKNVLPIIKTCDGEDFIELNDSFAFLTDWVESRHLDFKNPVELKMAVETLANLHLASRNFQYKKVKGRNLYGKWIDKFEKRLNQLLIFKSIIVSKDEKTEFDKVYLKHIDIHYKQGLDSIKKLKQSRYFEIVEKHKRLNEFCHHDSANHNFLVDDLLNVYLIDFDYCVLDSHLHDLASIIIRSLRYGNWSIDTLKYILSIYSRIIPIEDQEVYLIYCFMEFPQDFWQVGLQYYVENQPWEEDVFLKRLFRVTEDHKERFNFLDEFYKELGVGLC